MSNEGSQEEEEEEGDDERHQSIKNTAAPHIPQWAIDCGVLKSFVNLWYSLAVVEVEAIYKTVADNNDSAGLNSTTTTTTTTTAESPPPHHHHHYIGIYLNPTDIRCYRMIARPLCMNVNDLVFNQHADADTVISTSIAVAAIADKIQQQQQLNGGHLFVQSLHLGNNSMVADDEGEIKLGSDKEPYFYHVHLLCRGNPNRSYFHGAPTLGGPPIGIAFRAQDGRNERRILEEGKADTIALVDGLRNLLMTNTNKNTEASSSSTRPYARILDIRDKRFDCLD